MLFQPFELGPLTLKNRLVMTAMSTNQADRLGRVTPAMTAYYKTRAEGGVGLVTVEEASLHPSLPHIPRALGVYGDHLIPGLARLVEAIHQAGALASIQIGLYFRQGINGFPRYAVSAQAPDAGPGVLELTTEEIKKIVDLFADGAGRVKAAGFDAVEVHACHGCIISEFLSPFWNKRTDGYGGSRSGRFRLALEILAAIRERLGPAYPVLFRISGSEFYEEGFTAEDGVALSMALEQGGVTAINISGGLGHINHIGIPPSDVERGVLLPLGAGIKARVSVPVIVGNSLTPEMACKALEAGQADLVGLGRPLIADPEWPLKVQSGRAGEIRYCIRCNQGCFGGIRDVTVGRTTCLYNPQAGRETERVIRKADVPKTVVVVGGGPAGCEAARVAALRGHQVALFESRDRLGGQINLAAVPPYKQDFIKIIDYYQDVLPRLGVKVNLGQKATFRLIETLGPDVCILAMGSQPMIPKLYGAERAQVTDTHQVLGGRVEIDEGPVVVIGAGATGLETADLLSARGLKVTVIEMLDSPGRDIIPGIGIREGVLKRLEAQGASILTGHRAMAIGPDGVVVSARPFIGGGDQFTVPARHVIMAIGTRPDLNILPPAEPGRTEWHLVGDCQSPGNAMKAVHEAHDLALNI